MDTGIDEKAVKHYPLTVTLAMYRSNELSMRYFLKHPELYFQHEHTYRMWEFSVIAFWHFKTEEGVVPCDSVPHLDKPTHLVLIPYELHGELRYHCAGASGSVKFEDDEYEATYRV